MGVSLPTEKSDPACFQTLSDVSRFIASCAVFWLLVAQQAAMGQALAPDMAPRSVSPATLQSAEEAYASGDMQVAESLFRAYTLQYPSSDLCRVALLRAGQASLVLGNDMQALSDFAEAGVSRDAISGQAHLWTGLVYYRQQDYSRARLWWGSAGQRTDHAGVVSQAHFCRAWASIHMELWDEAGRDLDRCISVAESGHLASDGAGELRDVLTTRHVLPSKSATKARLLSTFVPGLGQIYAGKLWNGAVSLALNGTLMYIAARAVSDGRWVDAGFLYVIGGRFYAGGKQNAARFAHESNDAAMERFVQKLGRLEHVGGNPQASSGPSTGSSETTVAATLLGGKQH
jgi:hypothetical protein